MTKTEYHRHWRMKNRERRRALNKAVRQRNQEWFAQLKTTLVCEFCGEDHPATLDFHHLDPKTKDGMISTMVKRCYSRNKIQAEIEKCIVLCANCHRKLHAAI